MTKCYTIGTVTDLKTGKKYRLGGVNVIEACLTDMSEKVRKNCTFHITGGNGLIAIESDNGMLRIEKVETLDREERLVPTCISTLMAFDINNYTITED